MKNKALIQARCHEVMAAGRTADKLVLLDYKSMNAVLRHSMFVVTLTAETTETFWIPELLLFSGHCPLATLQ